MKGKLFALLAANAKRGEFKAEANTIYVYDAIVSNELEAEFFGGVHPRAFIDALKAMKGDVTIRVNSPGGSVFAAVAMSQAMREHKGSITVHVDGLAASAASVLAVTASKVVMAPGSFMMIHKASTLTWGNVDEHLATAELLEKVDGSIAESYARKSGGDATDFLAKMEKETWFTAAEAVEAGIADEIAEDGPKASAKWDLSAFTNAPAPVEVKPEEPAPEETTNTIEPTDPAPEAEIEQRQRQHAVRMLERAA